MRTITLHAEVGDDGRLHVHLPAGIPPGPVEVIVVLPTDQPSASRRVTELGGLGAEIWAGGDAQEDYVSRLRDESERS